MTRPISRRSILKQTAAVGAAGALPRAVTAQSSAPFRNLTAREGAVLEAVVARLIPSDENGPGATEAGAAHYVDLALGGALAGNVPTYRSGLAALDMLAQRRNERGFPELSASEQDALLESIEQDTRPGPADATGFPGGPASFFEMLRMHTIEGTFCDPHYGGNRDFIGWEMLGYPGIRLAVSASDQAMDADTSPSRVSAYDLPMFDDAAEPDE